MSERGWASKMDHGSRTQEQAQVAWEQEDRGAGSQLWSGNPPLSTLLSQPRSLQATSPHHQISFPQGFKVFFFNCRFIYIFFMSPVAMLKIIHLKLAVILRAGMSPSLAIPMSKTAHQKAINTRTLTATHQSFFLLLMLMHS